MLDTAYGYATHCGYFGRVGDHWMLFATEDDYYNYLREGW